MGGEFVDDGPSSMVDISIGQKLVEVMKVDARTSKRKARVS